MLDLAAAGALDMSFMHTTTVLVGSQRLYDEVKDFSPLRLQGVETTHHPLTLMALDRLVAVNSALEIDLFGQCNLENANGRAVSSAGGAPDFARAGRLSAGGRSIVAMQAAHPKGSRIVPTLGEKAIVSLSRVDVSHVVTEFGVADLMGLGVHERAEALIEVAAPEHRNDLRSAWQAVAARL
jgi:acyl-CoA hydrolase